MALVLLTPANVFAPNTRGAKKTIFLTIQRESGLMWQNEMDSSSSSP